MAVLRVYLSLQSWLEMAFVERKSENTKRKTEGRFIQKNKFFSNKSFGYSKSVCFYHM